MGGGGFLRRGTMGLGSRTLALPHPRTFAPSHFRTLAPSHPRTLAPPPPRRLAPSQPRSLAATHPRTLAPSHFRTFALSHVRTFALPYLHTRTGGPDESLARTKTARSAGTARDPHPPAPSPVHHLPAPSVAFPVRERGRRTRPAGGGVSSPREPPCGTPQTPALPRTGCRLPQGHPLRQVCSVHSIAQLTTSHARVCDWFAARTRRMGRHSLNRDSAAWSRKGRPLPSVTLFLPRFIRHRR